VVVGFDRHINYFKIQTAQLCISENPGCLFIATNLDAKTHLTDAQEWAGNGAMVGAIKGAPRPARSCHLVNIVFRSYNGHIVLCFRCQIMGEAQCAPPLRSAGQQANQKYSWVGCDRLRYCNHEYSSARQAFARLATAKPVGHFRWAVQSSFTLTTATLLQASAAF